MQLPYCLLPKERILNVRCPLIANFVKTDQIFQKFQSGHRDAHTQHGTLINLLSPLQEGKYAKN
jgi:hypothetical protein